MTEELPNEAEEPIHFWRGWRGLYVVVVVYAVLQIAILYAFTLAFNNS